VPPAGKALQLSPQTHAATAHCGENGRLERHGDRSIGWQPLAGANVRLLDENNGVIAQTTTESNGQYTFFRSVCGKLTEVEVEPTGFSRKNVIVGLNVSPGEENQFNTPIAFWGRAQKSVEVRADTATVKHRDSNAHWYEEAECLWRKPSAMWKAALGSGEARAACLRWHRRPPPPAFASKSRGRLVRGAKPQRGGQELGDLFRIQVKGPRKR